MHWAKLRRDEIAALAAAGAVPLLPIGSIEQHGPHLPLDTDTHAATAVCELAATLANDPPIVVLPPIWWGLSPYWMGFPGTLTLQPETILAVVSDLGASIASHGFRHLIIVNGHGGNEGIIGVGATLLARHGLRATALSYWALIAEELKANSRYDGGGIGHAGEVETSIIQHLAPHLVAALPAAEEGADLAAMGAAPFAGVGYAPPVPEKEAPSGVYGRADAGRAEFGELLLTTAAGRLASFVTHFVQSSS